MLYGVVLCGERKKEHHKPESRVAWCLAFEVCLGSGGTADDYTNDAGHMTIVLQ